MNKPDLGNNLLHKNKTKGTWNSSVASNILTEPNCQVICGFSKDFADFWIPGTSFFWMWELSPMMMELLTLLRGSEIMMELMILILEELQDSWVLTVSSLQNKEVMFMKKSKTVFKEHFSQFRELRSMNTSFLTSWTKMQKVVSVSFMCFQEPGLLTVTELW